MTIVTYISGSYARATGTPDEIVDYLNSTHVPSQKIISCVISGAVMTTLINIGGRSLP